MKPIVEIRDLAKRYRLAHAPRYLTLRDSIAGIFSAVTRGPSTARAEDFWALKGVTLDIQQGETIGLIGKNGSGKTTLLKVLSRITYPTRGEAVLRGRTASLLEVGTGFHYELSGRENIFFNGSILGMKKREIQRKFDEIVAFADVEKFIDTPVKRYSSGMQLRLAFAVAAHLETEILIVDEVLAVGDIMFQKKCIGKMSDVVRQGRTIIFVSHNMTAIQRLCSRVVLLDSGNVYRDGAVNDVIDTYLNYGVTQAGERCWGVADAPGGDVVRIRGVRVRDGRGQIRDEFRTYDPVTVEIEYEVLKANYPLNTLCYFNDESGQTKFVSADNLDSPWKDTIRPVGTYRCSCRVPGDLFNEGTVRITAMVTTSPYNTHAVVHDALTFKVIDDMSANGVRGNYPREWPQAVIRPRLKWDVVLLNTKDT